MAKRRNAWLTPEDTLPTVWLARCLAIPEPLYPSVIGALSLLTESWRWEQFGTMTPDDAAQLATVMLEGFASEGCSGMDCLDVVQCLVDAGLLDASLPNGEFQVVDGVPQVSFDEGVTWQDVISSGSSEPYVPTPTPTSGATDEIRKCLAATRAALVLNETYKGVYGAVAAGIYNASNTFANWLLVLNGQLLGLIYGEQYQILNSEILRDYSLPTNYSAGELTNGQIEELTCLLLDYAIDNPDGIVTFDWGAIRDNMIATMGVNPGTALWSIVVYLKNRGLERASQVAITGTGNCGPCTETWTQAALDGDGTRGFAAISEAAWTEFAPCTGSYNAGSDLFDSCSQGVHGGSSLVGVVISRTITPTTVTKLEADIYHSNSMTDNSYYLQLLLDGTPVVTQSAQTIAGLVTVSWTGSVVANQVKVLARNRRASSGGTASINRLYLEGEGSNPFT